MSIIIVPEDVLHHIFSFVPLPRLYRDTCKYFRDVIDQVYPDTTYHYSHAVQYAAAYNSATLMDMLVTKYHMIIDDNKMFDAMTYGYIHDIYASSLDKTKIWHSFYCGNIDFIKYIHDKYEESIRYGYYKYDESINPGYIRYLPHPAAYN
jgi:hypothetical protein